MTAALSNGKDSMLMTAAKPLSPIAEPSMLIRLLRYTLGSMIGYIILASSVINFYKDDPEFMDPIDRQKFNSKYIDQLNEDRISFASRITNTTTADVIYQLGSPDIAEAKEIDGIVYQMMFYRTHNLIDDGITTKSECTGLLFINDRLIGWSENSYHRYLNY